MIAQFNETENELNPLRGKNDKYVKMKGSNIHRDERIEQFTGKSNLIKSTESLEVKKM